MSDENFTDENLFDAAGAVNAGPGADDTEAEVEVVDYSEDDIRTLDWKEHIRRRPGMYIGKLGDGSTLTTVYMCLSRRCSTMASTSS